MKKEIKIISSYTAQTIWDNSFEANVFNNPFFLKNFKVIKFYGCFFNGEAIAAWPIYINYTKKKTIADIPWNFYYFGPFIHNNITSKPLHTKLRKIFDIYELYLLYFKSYFKKINFSLYWKNQDIRYFKWLSEKYTFLNVKINIRYTALIKNTFNINDWRRVRIQELKKIRNLENSFYITAKTKHDISDYLLIVKETIPVEQFNKDKHLYKKLIKLILENNNSISIIDNTNKELIGFGCVLRDKISHHLIFNFVKDSWKKKGLMVYLYKSLIENCFNGNLKYFDFNGANSFIGADDKSALGSNQELYFNIEIDYK